MIKPVEIAADIYPNAFGRVSTVVISAINAVTAGIINAALTPPSIREIKSTSTVFPTPNNSSETLKKSKPRMIIFLRPNLSAHLIRIDPDKARKLLVSLSHFLRQNLSTTTVNKTTLEQELKHTKAYLSIEETRFVDKLKVIYEIDEDALLEKIPPLTLQPIVENAITTIASVFFAVSEMSFYIKVLKKSSTNNITNVFSLITMHVN